jgi:heme/copper-type cytochrome/quinol oxidase subunit 2
MNKNNIFKLLLNNNVVSDIKIGTPSQSLSLSLKTGVFTLDISSNICPTNAKKFNPKNSKTYLKYEEYDSPYAPEPLTTEADESKDSFIINDINLTLDFFLYNTTKEYESGVLGIGLKDKNEDFNNYNFIFQIKKLNIIKSYTYTIIYEKKDSGKLIIGEFPHEYDKKKYNEKTYMKTNALKMILELGWIFEFKNYIYLNNGTKVSFGVTSLDKKTKGWLLFDLDIIIGVKDYLLYIQPNYFDKHKDECSFKLVDKRYTVFWCDKNFDTKDFPTSYFHSMDFNYIFELNYKDLFETRGDKKYFLIVFDKISNYPWKFGRIFMQKYFFNFETESKQIGFYNNLLLPDDSDEEIDKEKNKYKISFWILFGIIIILLGVGGYFIVYFIKKRNRKKRANELDDDFEYTQQKEENSNTNSITPSNNEGIN